MSYEVRVPGELLLSTMPDWAKVVWIAIRSRQGRNDSAEVSLKGIAERCIRTSGKPMDKSQTARAVRLLIAEKWLLNPCGNEYVCLVPKPQSVDQESTDVATSVDQESTIVDQESTVGVDQESTEGAEVWTRSPRGVDQESTSVDQESTRTENQKKTKVKTKDTQSARENEARDIWNTLAKRHGLASCRKLNPKRRKAIHRRHDEILSNWPAIRAAFDESAFLRGESGSWSGATFDFLWCREDSVNKILEGQYRDKRKTNGNHHGNLSSTERRNQLTWEAERAKAERLAARLEAADRSSGDALLGDGTGTERGPGGGVLEGPHRPLLGR